MPIHGKDTYFAVEDAAGATLRDISPYLNEVSFSRSNDTHDTTTFGAEGHTFIAGLTDGTISLSGFWDKTADVGSATVLNGLLSLDNVTVGWEYGPEGGGAGLVKYSGEAILESFETSSPVADLVSFSATLHISGAVTTGAFV